MADEEQTPRYSSACSGSNQVVQETNEASSTQDNTSEDPQIRPGVTPEAEKPFLTTSACSCDTVQPGTSSAAILQESAGSDKVWSDMLNDWYEKTIGNPQSAQFLGGTNDVPLNTAHDTVAIAPGHVDQLRSGSDFLFMDNTGESHTLTIGSQDSVAQGPDVSGNSARVPAGTLNLQNNATYGLARMSHYGVAAFKPPASSGRDSTAPLEPMVRRLQIGEESLILRNSASGATGSTQWEQRKDGVRGAVNYVKKPPGERRHICEICAKSFIRNTHLVEHRRIHTGEKPYCCEICAKLFRRQSELARHRHTHSGEKPYECATCAKLFARSHDLREHERTHTGETPYRCEMCGHSFVNRYFLKKHRLMHIPKELRKPPPLKKV